MKKELLKKSSVLVIACICWLGLTGCTRPQQATRTLENHGYTEIQITGWRPFMAGEDDTFSTGFRAKSPGGRYVTGTVTSGLLKGSTVRLD